MQWCRQLSTIREGWATYTECGYAILHLQPTLGAQILIPVWGWRIVQSSLVEGHRQPKFLPKREIVV